METLGKRCILALLLILGLCFTPLLHSVYLNNARAGRLVLKFDGVEQFFKIEDIEFEILKSSKNVRRGIGSATDCIYSASRSYIIIDPKVPLSKIETKISNLKLRPPIWKGGNHLSHVKMREQSQRPNLFIEGKAFGTNNMLVTIENGPYETRSALFDFRCG